jgi:hypothetical protein
MRFINATHNQIKIASEVTRMDEMNNFTEFISKRAKHAIGDGLIGASLIVFEFLTPDGKLGYSVLRPPGVSWGDTASLLINATETFEDAIAHGHMPHSFDNDGDFDLDDDLGYDDDIDYK